METKAENLHWTQEFYNRLPSDMTKKEEDFFKCIFDSIHDQYNHLAMSDFITIMKEGISNPIFPTLNVYEKKCFLFDAALDSSTLQIHSLIPTSLKDEQHLTGAKSVYTAGAWEIRINDNQSNEVVFRGDFGDQRSIFDSLHFISSLKQQLEFFEDWLKAKFDQE